jgi:hypothetical protein
MSHIAELVHAKDIQPTKAPQKMYSDVVNVVRVVQLEGNGGLAAILLLLRLLVYVAIGASTGTTRWTRLHQQSHTAGVACTLGFVSRCLRVSSSNSGCWI